MFVSLRLDCLRELTRAIGAWTPSSTVFFLGELFLVAICLNYAVRLSRAGLLIKNLAQEIAICCARQVEKLESAHAAGARESSETSGRRRTGRGRAAARLRAAAGGPDSGATHALVVIWRGRLVLERYGAGPRARRAR